MNEEQKGPAGPDSPPRTPGLEGARRKSIRLSKEELVRTEPLRADRSLPLLVRPAVTGVDLPAWAEQNREWIQTNLLKSGGILFRGFDVAGTAQFEQFILAISGALLEYDYGSTPRSHVGGRIYTSTEYPAPEVIPMHNEMSYAGDWPMKIWFLSVQPATEGGETPIADSRRVFQRIDPAIREKFARQRVMYVRNYHDGLDVPWQKVFQTEDRLKVEEYCRSAGIEYEWMDRGRLRTREVHQAVAEHPQTGEPVWFNQAHLFHVSNLPAERRDVLLAAYPEQDLPRNAYYGDGSPIEEHVLGEIREAYRQEAVAFPWEKGDVLMLDNMLTAHGRRPFVGPRKVIVGMAESFASGRN
jgi:alpha-ketoglutarate-dependent taurine dioxygenase